MIQRMLKDMGVPPEAIPSETKKLVSEAVKTFLKLKELHTKPIVGFTYRSLQEPMVRELLDRGIPIFRDPKRAARAMAAVLRYYQMRDGING